MINKDIIALELGQNLLERGFRTWFLYMFRIIEGRDFIVEPLHEILFEYYQNIFDGKTIRACINISPRSAKTTTAQYFLVFVLTHNPKSQIIYTSYSQSLLSEISNKVASILEHPAYKAMYPRVMLDVIKEETVNPIDDFWHDYLLETTGKNTYSSKKITTAQGGTCLFASCGSQITGYGAGIRNSKSFSGFLCMDDLQKPIDTKSEVLRQKTFTYFEETLLSRLNNPKVPIINIQQRLHVADISGFLLEKYNFDKLSIPLLDENGNCRIPSQYTPERLAELQKNNFLWQSQYMQNPIMDGGNVIKSDWFNYYHTDKQYFYKRTFITADTALKVKEANDFSVFIVAGVTDNNKLHIIDMVRGKWESPDLLRIAIDLWNRYKVDTYTGFCNSGLFIEDAASGVGLIQQLQHGGVPVTPIKADKDKLSRVETVLTYIQNGNVLLPNDLKYGFNPILLKECEEFSRDDSHLHDDIVDTLVMAINQGIAQTEVSLLDFFD